MSIAETAPLVTKLPSYTWTTALLTQSFGVFWSHYFGVRRYPEDQQFYVVYTDIDHALPFQPDTARNYWLVNFQFISTAVKLGDTLPRSRFDEIRNAYIETSREASACFQEAPTIMPHFAESGGQALGAARTLLKPLNCCPSLHTATPLFFYNLGATYFPDTEPQLRRYIGQIVSTIIKTKLHALIDIAFGIFLCKKVISDRLGLDFRDLESFFVDEQARIDGLPYDLMYRMYHEINHLASRNGDKPPAIMKDYFDNAGFPRVTRQRSNCYYDLEQKTLVYSKDLRVGGGCFSRPIPLFIDKGILPVIDFSHGGWDMIERVHEHIISELEQNTRTDTIFLITSIFLNLITLGVNSAVAASSSDNRSTTTWVVFFTFFALLIVVNFVVEIAIIKGKQTRNKLLNGLLKMYKDQGVEGYYDASLLSNYNTRYNLFMLVVLFTGVIAIVVPLVLIF